MAQMTKESLVEKLNQLLSEELVAVLQQDIEHPLPEISLAGLSRLQAVDSSSEARGLVSLKELLADSPFLDNDYINGWDYFIDQVLTGKLTEEELLLGFQKKLKEEVIRVQNRK